MMFHPLIIARRVAAAGSERVRPNMPADAIRPAAEHGNHATPEMLRTELHTLRADIYHAVLLQTGAVVGALAGIAGIAVGILRPLH